MQGAIPSLEAGYIFGPVFELCAAIATELSPGIYEHCYKQTHIKILASSEQLGTRIEH